MLRIVLADDHEVVRAGLRMVLESHSDLEVVGEAADGEAAFEAALKLEPDVLVMDLSMPRVDGVAAAEKVRKAIPKVKVVALTLHAEPSYVQRLLQAGASGYVLKRSPTEELVKAIRLAARGGTYVDAALSDSLASIVRAMPAAGSPDAANVLSKREREVLICIARGFSNKEIAATLRVSVKTVETYKARLTAKLGLKSRVEIVNFAIGQGWLTSASEDA